MRKGPKALFQNQSLQDRILNFATTYLPLLSIEGKVSINL